MSAVNQRHEGAASTESLEYVQDLPGFKPNCPTYFENELIDHLIGITLELGAELWVMRDRQAHLIELLASKGMDVQTELEQGRPTATTEAQLKAEREAMIKRIYARLYSRYGGEKASGAAAPM